jgi:hypothetical protein
VEEGSDPSSCTIRTAGGDGVMLSVVGSRTMEHYNKNSTRRELPIILTYRPSYQ